MCNAACIMFGKKSILENDVAGKRFWKSEPMMLMGR